jgi:4-hydroxy-tetrahydrodipicolinate reductase
MVNIGIIGYGKMGQLIEKIAIDKGHNVNAIIDPVHKDAQKEINEENLKNIDVCIDFTHPKCAIDNIKKLATLKKNMVIGTTGWYDKMDEVKQIVKESGVGFIWSGNYSIGVNAFFEIIKHASKIMNNLKDYDIMATEVHHNGKADSPSGTAEMIGKILIDNITRKEKLVKDRLNRKIDSNELHLASIRGGSVPGTHTIYFDSLQDTIELKHTARNREGFAKGAVLACEFINKKKGFYSINDLMKDIQGIDKNDV